jgi:selenocysteine-specific elongation factor
MSINKQIVVGMSGHIDHGKTSIVKHLTGKNTDTLKQEQERGMTIDLGFAFLNDQITIIDVPGHEKFVKNMMSGSSGIDIAALVIAADDGIMPQTKEHFDILQLLDIKYGFIILNKIDLVDKEWIELVENEIEELSRGSFLENCKIIQTSASVGVGINLIKDTILDLSSQIPSRKKDGIFRMHIDRVFSKTGFGTVVTGTISSGTVSIGDNLDLIPTFKNVKVRNIQTHGVDVKSAFSGERVAINLNNLDSNNLERGFHLSKQDTYTETKLIIAELKLIKSDSFEFKNNQRLRIHLGTREVMSRVSIINQSDKGLIVLLKLERPLVGAMGDRFIVRLYSPVRTVAGGLILEIPKENNWRKIKNISSNILELDYKDQIYRIINNLSSSTPMKLSDVERKLNISLDDFKILIKDDN